MDATLIETAKSTSFFGYKGYSCYQPLNVWWAEQEMVLYSEFRDGNVPAGYEPLRVLKEALDCLPEGIDTVRLRSDTAGYQHDLLKYCERGDTGWGRIAFAIGCNVSSEFKRAVAEIDEADWHDLYVERNGKRIKKGTQWAEVCFVPNRIGHSQNGPAYRNNQLKALALGKEWQPKRLKAIRFGLIMAAQFAQFSSTHTKAVDLG